MKTRAMVLVAFNAPLQMREIDVPPLRPGEVLVRIEAAGVCGSDVHMWRGKDERTPLPIVLGHEGVGTVADTGGEKRYVTGEAVKTGDRVIWNRGASCGRCYFCAVLLRPWLCPERKVYGINTPLSELSGPSGCYAEHLVLSAATDIIRVDADIDPAVLVSASCSGATAAHAFDEHPVPPGGTVVVLGPGPLGAYAVAFASRLGAGETVVIGGAESRLKICEEFGATAVLNRRTTERSGRKERVMALTSGRGADLVFEAAGDPQAVAEGLDLLRPGGTFLTVGFSQPPGRCEVDFFRDVVRKNVRIQGVWVSGTGHTLQALSIVARNGELFGRMVTHRFGLPQADAALASMESREALKAVLVPGR